MSERKGNGTYVIAMVVFAALALVGLAAAIFLQANPEPRGARTKVTAPAALDTASDGR